MLSRASLIWLVIYAGFMAGTILALCYARQWSLVHFSTAQSQRDWQQWQQETRRQAIGQGPVQRRPNTSGAPPTLRLMRDHFMTILTFTVIFSSVIFFTIMVMLRGASRTSSVPRKEG